MRQRRLAVSSFLLSSLALCTDALARSPDYLREVRPILTANCFRCHGQDEAHRSAGLRLDAPNRAVIPGDVVNSELTARILATDASQMPPKETGHTLTASQKRTLLRWIDDGAKYEKHWSFVSPSPPAPLPDPLVPRWKRGDARSSSSAAGRGSAARYERAGEMVSPIDRFVGERLAKEGLTFSPEADRYTLARRVALDLTGIPPTPEESERFVNDRSPDAYEKLVRRLLRSQNFGEKWARPWLDLGRFADSAGYGSDPLRPNLWPWRDYVIRSLNANKPYDVFGTELIAGDLLPNPTTEQLTATAFHRNTMTNTEGGTDDEEFRIAAVKDRAIVTMQAFTGLTVQCAQCHTHKYDPITQRDFYRLMALFNQTEDNDQPDERPTMPYLTAEQVGDKIKLEAELKTLEAKRASEPKTVPTALFVRVTKPGSGEFVMLAEVEVWSGGKNIAREGKASQSSTDFGGPAERAIDGKTNGRFDDGSVTHTAAQTDPWWEVDLGTSVPIDAVTLWARTDAHQTRLAGARLTLYDADHKAVGETILTEAPSPSKRVETSDSPTARLISAKRAQLAAIKPVALPILKELPAGKRRVSHVLTLGNFLMPSEVVNPGVPAAFSNGATVNNRLDLARWLFSKQNPFTARVAVNRIWAQLFGVGLAETEEDFGTMGALPSHPELLEALALDFQKDWNVKRLIETILLSRTYRQSAKTTPDRLAKDPKARLLSRYPRRRLDAEGVRDSSLALSGLLSQKIGGPSVFPPQPDGLWKAAFNGERSYPTSMGEDRFRRGLYTFWRRTVPYPALQTFDAPSRESCLLRRMPTNTPLQALVTLNDPSYLEMAMALGRRIASSPGKTTAEKARWGLRLVLGRPPTESQVQTVAALWADRWENLRTRPDDAKKLAESPALPPPGGGQGATAELAAWTLVGNVLLNLDAVLTRS